jgi:predicted metal-dependent TIM-barrel fold hydrolase
MFQQIPTIRRLNGLALRKIFDKLNAFEEKELGEGIEQQIRKKNLSLIEKRELSIIVDALIKNERGGYKKIIETYKQHGIDWRLVYRRGL